MEFKEKALIVGAGLGAIIVGIGSILMIMSPLLVFAILLTLNYGFWVSAAWALVAMVPATVTGGIISQF